MDGERLEEMARRLIAKANERGIALCLLGGLGVKFACSRAIAEEPSLARPINDIDLASYSYHRVDLTTLMLEEGFQPYKEFNILNAAYRQRFFYGTRLNHLDVDIFFDDFRMCHIIPLKDRIKLGQTVLEPGLLLLTKLQIVELSKKDISDILIVLLAYAMAKTYESPPPFSSSWMDIRFITGICSQNWGLHHTVTFNLRRISQILCEKPILKEKNIFEVLNVIRELEESNRLIHKSIRWRIRSILGENLRWYDVPEVS